MKIRLLYISIAVVFLTLYNSCKKETSINSTNGLRKNSSKIRYAEGFDIQHFTNHKKLIIKKPYPDASKNLVFILRSSPSKKEDTLSLKTIHVPVKNIVVTSTTHIPMLELLGVEKSLVGFQDTNYISSEKTRKRIDSGFVRELGNEAAMNTEVLFELQPDVVIGFAMNSVCLLYTSPSPRD